MNNGSTTTATATNRIDCLLVDPATGDTKFIMGLIRARLNNRINIFLVDPNDIIGTRFPQAPSITDEAALENGRDMFRDDGIAELIRVTPKYGASYRGYGGEQLNEQQFCCYLGWVLGFLPTIVPAVRFQEEFGTRQLKCEEAVEWTQQGRIPYLEKETCNFADRWDGGFAVAQEGGKLLVGHHVRPSFSAPAATAAISPFPPSYGN